MNYAEAATDEDMAYAEKILAERQAKYDSGFKLYPGVGWVKPDPAEKPIYTTNPETGEKIMDLEAMIKDRKARGIELDGEIGSDTSGWNIAGSKLEATKTMSYMRGYGAVPTTTTTTSPENNQGTVFYFDGFEPFNRVIFQPVLQYGHSMVCNVGENWVTYPLINALGSASHGSCTPANEEPNPEVQSDIWPSPFVEFNEY